LEHFFWAQFSYRPGSSVERVRFPTPCDKGVHRDKVENSHPTNGSLTTQVRPSTSTNANIAKPTVPIGSAPSVNTNAQLTNSLGQRVTDAALRQIAALQEEKARRTPTQQK